MVMLDRIISSFVALGLALLVWLYARSRDQELLDNVPLPVKIALAAHQADHFNLEVGGASQVLASFSGPPQRIRELAGLLQRNELRIDVSLVVPDERLTESRYSDTVVIEPSDVHVPPGVTVSLIEGRNRVPVTVHRLIERRLPVRFDHVGDEPSGPLVIEPATVLVRGPQEVLERARAIPTQPSELPGRPANAPPGAAAVGRVVMVQELEGRPVRVEPPRVTVRVPPQTRKVYTLPDVPIRFLCPANFAWRPAFYDERSSRVSLRLQGPVLDDTPKIHLYVDLTIGRFDSGKQNEPLQIQLPKDFALVDEVPRVVTFDLQPGDAPLFGASELIPKRLEAGSPP
jgi:hypothetical protein